MVQKSETTTVWMVLKPCREWDFYYLSLNWLFGISSIINLSFHSFSIEIHTTSEVGEQPQRLVMLITPKQENHP